MVRWHHQFHGHELGQTMGDGEGRGPWSAAVHEVAELDMTWKLNHHHLVYTSINNLIFIFYFFECAVYHLIVSFTLWQK